MCIVLERGDYAVDCLMAGSFASFSSFLSWSVYFHELLDV
jgi:hypothetical protein